MSCQPPDCISIPALDNKCGRHAGCCWRKATQSTGRSSQLTGPSLLLSSPIRKQLLDHMGIRTPTRQLRAQRWVGPHAFCVYPEWGQPGHTCVGLCHWLPLCSCLLRMSAPSPHLPGSQAPSGQCEHWLSTGCYPTLPAEGPHPTQDSCDGPWPSGVTVTPSPLLPLPQMAPGGPGSVQLSGPPLSVL